MDSELRTDNGQEYFFIKTRGEIKALSDRFKLLSLYYGEIIKSGKKMALIDESEVSGQMDISHLILMEEYYSKEFANAREIKVAVLTSYEHARIGKFWETYCENRGYSYKAFLSMDEAKKWLIN